MATQSIHTVTGPIAPEKLGRTLIHEHLLVDFAGAKKVTRDSYDRGNAVKRMLPYLKTIREQGVESFLECTPMYIGRDPLLCRELSEASGVQILINTGLYAAGQRQGEPEPYLPQYAYDLEAEHLAGGWLKEWYEGVEGTGIRPGFVKIGVNPGEMRPISAKMVKAGAITARHSGLCVASHTGRGRSALESLDIFEKEGVSPNRYVFVHAQAEKDLALQVEVARRGGWVSLDGIGPKSAEAHLRAILNLLEKGYEDSILISQDAGWYRPGQPNGGEVRGFEYLMETFVPAMLEKGIPQATVDHLLIHNPARAFTVKTEGA